MTSSTSRTMRVFTIVWFGQLVSLIGSGLTNFGLGVWVFQQTQSATLFGLISLFAVLPGIIISPFAGSAADRYDRRKIMILSDCVAAIATLSIALLFYLEALEVWHIYLAVALSSSAGAFQGPAYAAATSQLVDEEQLGRANGLVQLGQASGQLIAPMLAGALVSIIQIQGVILIDVITFLVSMLTLSLVRFPATARAVAQEQTSLLKDAASGWRNVRAYAGLTELMVFFAVANLLVGVVSVLVTPLVLSFASATALGTILSIGGAGMVVGSVVLSAWGGPKRRISGVLGFLLVCGGGLVLAGLQPSVLLVTIAAFLFFFSLPFVNGFTNAIIQSKVDLAMQGRVFAVLQMIATSATPIAYLAAGPIADRFFNPLLLADGQLAGSVGQLIGVGPGRGIGLMFIVIGLLLILLTLAGMVYPALQQIESSEQDRFIDTNVNQNTEKHKIGAPTK